MLVIEKKYCTGCTSCANICPKKAITMIQDENGFQYPKIDEEKCIKCNLCKKVCPVIDSKEEEKEILAYACYNKEIQERLKSSSGGIFIMLAKQIINMGGVVCGAYMDEQGIVRHTCADNEQGLLKFMGSKYVQSDLGNIYKQVENYLKQGRYVLFTGTPCQVEGILKYLKKDYDNLFTQDIICHGVPSPKVWSKYLKFRKNNDKDIPLNISFRDKVSGWKNFGMTFNYKQDKKYSVTAKKDPYFRVFLHDYILRESCYNCSFKKTYRNSDITLADFWGIENVNPQMFDDNGVSALIINSKKGQELFDKIKQGLVYEKTDVESIIKYNPAFNKSAIKSIKREKVLEKINERNFSKISNKYTENTLIHKMLKLSKKVMSKARRMIIHEK